MERKGVDPTAGDPDGGRPLEELMAAYVTRGDRAAFEELFARLAPKVNLLLLRLSHDRELAAELTQVTFLKVHRARDTWVPGSRVFSWVMAIARNVYIDAYRRKRVRRRHEVLTEEGTLPEPVRHGRADEHAGIATLSDEDRKRIQDTIDALPPTQREALLMLKVEGLSLKQVSEITGASVAAVKVRAFRAYEALRAALGVPPRDPSGEDSRKRRGPP